ncbi:MAG: type II toxin-antitoxin system HigB family toxin [Phycisphaeraceae bacterium]
MRIIKPARVRQYAKDHPDAAASLMGWLKAARDASWGSLMDVRRNWRHADGVKASNGRTVTVFNIAGNAFRLVTAIHYDRRTVYVLRFLTHAEYSKDR